MELKLYDTLTREKRVFQPIDPANVRMYVCGPTVYDFAHIGNARPAIVFDVLFRLLRHLYGAEHVNYVRNITDVDDKINARAVRDYPGVDLNEAIRKVTEATEAQFQADVNALGCLPPTHQPRATEFVLPRSDGLQDMKSLIQELLDHGNAYVAKGTEGKEVLFDVSSMPDYGALSGRKLEDQKAGARIAVDEHKNNPGDFVLWKESGAKEPGWKGEYEFVPDPRSGYDANFIVPPENARRLGLNSRVVTIHGRPGWHIECSAMSAAYLGKVFDIHGGGLDLIFPHHENEIAQSRCAHGTQAMANYWMHNGFLQVEGEKMSKSLGNFVTIRELLRRQPGSVLRFAMLKTHYRAPIDWTELSVQESRRELIEWSDFVDKFPHRSQSGAAIDGGVIEMLCQDLNTPEVITRMRALFKEAQNHPETELPKFIMTAKFLGLHDVDRAGHFRGGMAYHVPKGREEDMQRASALAIAARVACANNLPEAGSLLKQIEDLGVNYAFTPSGDLGIWAPEDPSLECWVADQIARRAEARRSKNFAESDRIRDELAAMGVVLKDSKDGTTWEIAR